MTYPIFVNICDKLGDQTLSPGERWKSIQYMHCDEHPVFDFQALYKNNQAYFIVNEEGAEGFIILEKNANEHSIVNSDTITFIDLRIIYSISFICKDTINSIAYTASQVISSDIPTTIRFNKDEYVLATVADLNSIDILFSDLDVEFKTAIFSDETSANAAVAYDDVNALEMPIAASSIYYLKVFAQSPYSGSAIVKVTIL